MKLLRFFVLVLSLFVLSAGTLGAQGQTVTQADVQRLQDALADAGRDVSGAQVRDATLATRLDTELNELRDDVAYIRVKLRKNEPVARADYFDLRDKIDDLRARARGEGSRTNNPNATASSRRGSTASGVLARMRRSWPNDHSATYRQSSSTRRS